MMALLIMVFKRNGTNSMYLSIVKGDSPDWLTWYVLGNSGFLHAREPENCIPCKELQQTQPSAEGLGSGKVPRESLGLSLD